MSKPDEPFFFRWANQMSTFFSDEQTRWALFFQMSKSDEHIFFRWANQMSTFLSDEQDEMSTLYFQMSTFYFEMSTCPHCAWMHWQELTVTVPLYTIFRGSRNTFFQVNRVEHQKLNQMTPYGEARSAEFDGTGWTGWTGGTGGRSRKVSFKFLHTLWVYRLCIYLLVYEIKIVTNILMGFKISCQVGGRGQKFQNYSR